MKAKLYKKITTSLLTLALLATTRPTHATMPPSIATIKAVSNQTAVKTILCAGLLVGTYFLYKYYFATPPTPNTWNMVPVKELTDNDISTLNQAFNFKTMRFHKSAMDTREALRAEIVAPQGTLTGSIIIYQNHKDQDNKKITNIEYIAVLPQYQKKGIGKALIERVAFLTECTTMNVFSTDTSEKFYLQIGFSYLSKNSPLQKNFEIKNGDHHEKK